MFVGSLGFVACGASPTSPTSSAVTFSIVDLKVGDGDTIANGDRVQVWYKGWIYVKSAPGNKGQSFDSNREYLENIEDVLSKEKIERILKIINTPNFF